MSIVLVTNTSQYKLLQVSISVFVTGRIGGVYKHGEDSKFFYIYISILKIFIYTVKVEAPISHSISLESLCLPVGLSIINHSLFSFFFLNCRKHREFVLLLTGQMSFRHFSQK